jgi:hypothetical protein
LVGTLRRQIQTDRPDSYKLGKAHTVMAADIENNLRVKRRRKKVNNREQACVVKEAKSSQRNVKLRHK